MAPPRERLPRDGYLFFGDSFARIFTLVSHPEVGVKAFKGAVVCVSHDQFFVNAIANEAWVVANGAVKRVDSFEAYRQRQLKKLNKNTPQIKAVC